MIWRFFRRREQTTIEEEKQTEPVSSRAPTSAHTPSMSAFSFRTVESAKERVPTAPADTSLDTAVDVGPVVPPQADVASVIREKTKARTRERVADRGVQPVLVPNLSQLASTWRVSAMRLERNRPEEALEFWTAYLSLHPSDVDGWFQLGQTALSAKDTEVASQAFLQVCDREPENGLAHGALGYIASEHAFYEEAVERYEKAVSLRPSCRDMLSELLRCQRLSGDEESAVRTSERLARLDLEG